MENVAFHPFPTPVRYSPLPPTADSSAKWWTRDAPFDPLPKAEDPKVTPKHLIGRSGGMKSNAWLGIFLLAGCANLPSSSLPLSGQWGGTHVRLVLERSGGRLEYDCAGGTIGPIVPRPDGSFEVEGTHTPAAGGPEIEGQIRPTYRTRFNGNLRGDRMNLAGRVENGALLGPFELRRGAEPNIFRCL